MVERIAASIFCPLASLSVLPIIVDNPISCLASDVDIPTLLLLLPTPFDWLIEDANKSKLRHSGPSCSTLSEITWPHLLHISSPDSESVIIWLLLHMEHTGVSCEFDESFRLLV